MRCVKDKSHARKAYRDRTCTLVDHDESGRRLRPRSHEIVLFLSLFVPLYGIIEHLRADRRGTSARNYSLCTHVNCSEFERRTWPFTLFFLSHAFQYQCSQGKQCYLQRSLFCRSGRVAAQNDGIDLALLTGACTARMRLSFTS